MPGTKKYELELLEDEYRELTTNSNLDSAARMRTILAHIRYDLANELEVHMQYQQGLDEPILMRILRTEKDLDRWVEQRFVRLSEF